jgi:alpha-beta hydrolase superfamily lysophospholipase
MDLNIINSFLFHPRKSYQDIGKNDFLINLENSVQVGIRLHLINQTEPTILFFHGNGEIGPEYDDIAQLYNQKNINFIIADFRGYGFSSGVPDVKNTQSDAHIILDFVLKYLKEKNYFGPLILMGRSLGSVSVLELAKRYPHDFSGLIIESGFADEEPLFTLIGTTVEQAGFNKKDGFLNGEKIKKYTGPVLIIHAEQDHIVPFSQGERLYNYCSSKNKKLLPIPNANHNNILSVSPQVYFEEVERFIKQ